MAEISGQKVTVENIAQPKNMRPMQVRNGAGQGHQPPMQRRNGRPVEHKVKKG